MRTLTDAVEANLRRRTDRGVNRTIDDLATLRAVAAIVASAPLPGLAPVCPREASGAILAPETAGTR